MEMKPCWEEGGSPCPSARCVPAVSQYQRYFCCPVLAHSTLLCHTLGALLPVPCLMQADNYCLFFSALPWKSDGLLPCFLMRKS